jgi:hypothetical protein
VIGRTATRVLVAALALASLTSSTTQAYLKLGSDVNGSTISLKWPSGAPVRYFIADRGVSGVSAAQFRDAVERGFETWEAVRTASIAFEFAGFVGGRPLDQDDANVIGFAARPDLERTLASTSFLIDTRNGEILESDIFFNSTFDWSVAPGGEAGRFDVQSIATHEAGHLLGLGHSLLGETEARPSGGRRLIASAAVMFPIAFTAGNIVDRDLAADDIAGVSDIYSTGGFRRDTGTLQGTVTKGGRGVFGAHVVAFNPRTGDLVGGFSLDDAGNFAIPGLSPGTYIVRVEPLDDGDVESFFEASANVDADFKAAYYPRQVTVPKGNGSARITIEVSPK